MKGKAIIPLALGLCVGLVAVKYLVDTIQKAKGANTPANMIMVVRAKHDIDSYEEITPEVVELIETGETNLIPEQERISTLEDVVGRVTAKSIPQHTPVLKSMLAEKGTPARLVGRIPPGFRAVSVKIDEVTAVAYQLKPGDWVDVIVVMDVESRGRSQRRETIAEVILQHVQIAAIGQGMSSSQATKGTSIKSAKSATLLIAQEDVPKLHLAATRGKITLSMRGPDEKVTRKPKVARGSEVFASMYRNKPPQSSTPRNTAEPEPIYQEPLGVTVFRSSATLGLEEVERIMFDGPRSRTIVGVSAGATSAGESMRATRRVPTRRNAGATSNNPNSRSKETK